ncbi:MAG: hypothetical protein GY913_16295 [Proteobacteria bacterium]|nr:hypothetical protein [Pseudomonadota bacterium]MCP4918465.1 hypothetical protein [Pseudomonadota bacterium]
MDLDARTLDTLDWPAIAAAVAPLCRTLKGARTPLPLASERDDVLTAFRAVQEIAELADLEEVMPLGAISDLSADLARVGQGSTLELLDLHKCASTLVALEHVRVWLVDRAEQAPTLSDLAIPIDIDAELLDHFGDSFTDTGQLNEHRYPEIAELRRTIQGLHGRIRETLDRLVKGRELEGILQDRYVTQRADRYVLPIRAEARRKGLGIVHDTSGSGETVFVEPAEVVELNNKLRLAEGEERRAVARILAALSRLLARYSGPIQRSLNAAVRLDHAQARERLGRQWGGIVPEIGRGGVIDVQEARHPVLVLRELDVVPNDLCLDEVCRGLILSGPNTGGKTVALKTLGSFALLVRAGIPVPARSGRVDCFGTVLADIGDLQSVEGDLSTFSGHVLVLRELLARACSGSLILLDEIAVGTDPAQGGALARSVLETLVDRGARVAVTTHYTDLKAFAAADDRFRNAAVHLEDGKPSYQVRADAVGLSHAFTTARRLGLEPAVVDRAEGHLDASQREVGSLLEELELQRVAALKLRDELEESARRTRQKERELEARWEQIRGKSKVLAEREAGDALARLKAAEDEVRTIIATLQRNPTLQGAGKDLARVRGVMQDVAPVKPVAPTFEPPPRELDVGDRVRIVSLGKAALVTSKPKKGKVEVSIKGLKTRVKLNDLRLLDGTPVAAKKPKPPPPVRADEKVGSLRTERNTCDVRGKRVEEAIDALGVTLDRLVMQNESVCWVLHGHGTGALKTALRRWLKTADLVQSARPANVDEGGDAFTRVEL